MLTSDSLAKQQHSGKKKKKSADPVALTTPEAKTLTATPHSKEKRRTRSPKDEESTRKTKKNPDESIVSNTSQNAGRLFKDALDPKKKKEEEKLIALIHPEFIQGLDALFEARQRSGYIKTDQFLQIISMKEEIIDVDGLHYSTAHFLPILQNQITEYDALTRNGCLVQVGKVINMAKKQSEKAKKEAKSSEKQVKYVSFGTYLKKMCNCSLRSEKNVEIRWEGMPSMDPKSALVLIVLVVAFVMAVMLVIALSALNADLALHQIKEQATIDQKLYNDLTTTLFSSTLQQYQKFLDSLAKMTQTPMDNALKSLTNASQNVLLNSNFHSQAIASQEAARVMRKFQRELEVRFMTIDVKHNYLGAADAEIATWLKKTDRANLLSFMISLDSNNTRLQPSLCDASGQCGNVPCVSQLLAHSTEIIEGAAASVFHETSENTAIFNVPFLMASKIYDKSMAICMVRLLDNAARDTMITDLSNLFTCDRTTQVTRDFFARRVEERSNFLPTCQHSVPFLSLSSISRNWMQGVTVFPDNVTYAIPTEDEFGAITAHSYPLWRLNLYFLAREKKSVIVSSIKAGLAKNVRCDDCKIKPYVVETSSDKSQYTILGQNITLDPSLVPQSVLGLNNIAGALFSNNVDYSHVVAGYTPLTEQALNLSLSLIVEYGETAINELAYEIIAQVVRGVRDRTDESIDVMAISRSTNGSLHFLVNPRLEHDKTELFYFASKCFRGEQNRMHDTVFEGMRYARCVRISTLPSVIVSVARVKPVQNTLLLTATYALLVGLALALIALVLIRYLTRRVLDHIEKDYVSYKKQIEAEKHQFSELVKDVMPQYISKRYMAGEKLIVDSHPQLTFMFSDIVAFTETSRKMSTVELIRILGYMFMVEDGVAEHYGIHKIKTIGDAYFCVSGLDDLAKKRLAQEKEAERLQQGASETQETEKPEEVKLEDNQVFRMVSFTTCLHLLLSDEFTHVPERTECFSQHAGGTVLGPFKMLRLRMGIHTGPAIAGVVDVGRAPHFDCFGPSVNLASRMESTAPVDKIQLSAPTWELLQSADPKGIFEFDAPRKTLCKGYGTIKTYTIKATCMQVPDEVIKKLYIDRAVQRQFFTSDGLSIGDDGKQLTEGSHTLTSSRRSSDQHVTHTVEEEGTGGEEAIDSTEMRRQQASEDSPQTLTFNFDTAPLPPPLPDTMFSSLPPVIPPPL